MAQLGLVNEITAQEKCYDYALLLGATTKTIIERLNYLIAQWNNGIRWKSTVILTGQRFLEKKEQEYLVQQGAINVKTETEMIQFLWKNTEMPDRLLACPTIFVDTPQRNGQRPTTADTVAHWLSFKPRAGTCLCVSNQPYIHYQQAIMQKLLPLSFTSQTIGPILNPKTTTVTLIIDSLARWIYAEKS